MNPVLQNKLQEMSKLLKIAYIKGYQLGYKEAKADKPERSSDIECSCKEEPSPSCDIHGMFIARSSNG